MQANIFLSLFFYFIFYCFASTRFRRRAMKWLIVINGKAPAHWGALKESLLDAVFDFPAKTTRALVEADYLI
jgi:hypothetical protein